MRINKQKIIVILLVTMLTAIIPLVAAAPSGTSEPTVVEVAKSWIGVKSVHGGDNRSGIDCSHLVFQVYKQAGARDIVFQTVPNMKKNAYYVNTTSPTPGDVIFWKKDITQNNRNYWLVNHVGIYIGNEQFIDTSFDTKLVAIESISGVYKDGMPYYARWDPDGSGNNNLNLPVAAFSIYPTSGKAPLNVIFTDQSTDATSWSWNFGDGNTSAEKNPTHTYSEAGNYTVVLAANNEIGSNSKSLNIIVEEEQSQEIILPVANFNANTTSGSAPLTVQFTDLSQNAVSWSWDFNDDEVADSIDRNPIYQYTVPGNYTVKLTIGNENGINSTTQKIIVQNPMDPPLADFSTNVTSGYAPLAVQFSDLSQNVIVKGWDFNNDWQIDSIDIAPVYVFTAPGSYSVNLIVTNENGTSTKTTTITVLEESSNGESSDGNSNSGSSGSHRSGSSHHSSGGSGGGTGGSPEPQKNVAVKDTTKVFISGDKPVYFNFTNDVTVVDYISFTSEKTVGKTTAIVENLKNKSSLVSELPAGVVYKSFNVWVGNGGYGDSDNILNATINFKVGKSWIKENDIDPSSIMLYKYNDKKKEWLKLSVTQTDEDDQFIHFTSNVPGYSSFVITGEKGKKSTQAPEPAGTVKNGNLKDDTNAIASKISGENEKSPGFELLFGFISLLCVSIKLRGR